MNRVTIVIPNYNGIKFIGQCLDSIKRLDGGLCSVIVVDNGSTDDSRELIEKNYAWVRCIALGYNSGFARACNEGIKAAQTEFVVLLNNDIEVHPQWLAELVAAMDRHPECGMGTSKMLFFDVRDVIYNTGDCFHVSCKGGARGMGRKDDGQYEREEYVFGACAGAGIYRKALFDTIGLFDEDFFAFAEDVDLNVRAKYYGYSCIYVPKAVVYHVGSATAGFHSNWHVSLFARNDLFVLVKNFGLRDFVRHFPKIARARLRMVKTTAQAGQGGIVFAAWLSFLRFLPAMLAKRYVLRNRVDLSLQPFKELVVDE